MRSFALLALASAAAAQYKGFNYGSTNPDGSGRVQSDFESLMSAAKSLTGASGFTSARLYTMIQEGTTNTPISAIQAAIDTKTTLLLGLWASAGQTTIDNEIAALKTAISQYGTAFTDLIAGISVGSEDLYRNSPTGIENKDGVGANPSDIVSYISQVKSAISGTGASGAKIGHVDTWTAWVNGSNDAVISAVDWLGVDSYPYFETTESNGIANGGSLFFESYNNTVNVAGGKEVWITETGWPVSGPTSGEATTSTQNAEIYWQDVACRVLGNINTWWYTLYDPESSSNPSFALQGELGGAPLYDLTCSASSSSSSSSSSASSTGKASGSSTAVSTGVIVATASATGSGSGSSTTGGSSASGTGSTGGQSSNGTDSTSTGYSAPSTPTMTTSASSTSYTGAAAPLATGFSGLVAAVVVALLAM